MSAPQPDNDFAAGSPSRSGTASLSSVAPAVPDYGALLLPLSLADRIAEVIADLEHDDMCGLCTYAERLRIARMLREALRG